MTPLEANIKYGWLECAAFWLKIDLCEGVVILSQLYFTGSSSTSICFGSAVNKRKHSCLGDLPLTDPWYSKVGSISYLNKKNTKSVRLLSCLKGAYISVKGSLHMMVKHLSRNHTHLWTVLLILHPIAPKIDNIPWHKVGKVCQTALILIRWWYIFRSIPPLHLRR